MKRFFFIASLLVSVCAFAQIEKVLPAPQNPPKLYNDFTKGKNFLTPEQSQALETKLVAYDDSTSNQVVIVIVESLEGYDPNTYATALGRKWGVGGKEHNNGVVILISTEEGNRDAYIAIGYGLEGAIPDMIAASIVDHEIIENFKKGNFYRGLDGATDAIIKAAAGEYTAPEGYRSNKPLPRPFKLIIAMIIFIIIVSVMSKGGRGGGGYASRRGWLGPTIFGGGLGSGGWGGGGWSGGGGGGFGGFGGGSFGGGGAGGRW